MTYCLGMRTKFGVVLIADTRTNAGIDNISNFRKLHTLIETPDRMVVCASAGSLSTTQTMLSLLEEGLDPRDPADERRTVASMPSMFRVVSLVGEALMLARREVARAVSGTSINSDVSLLVGGRIGDGPMALFLVYSEGNFIECLPDCPFAQVGELKYGKPILDRTLNWDTSLEEAVKVGLLSFDATMRSNLSVGLPLDLIVIPEDRSEWIVQRRLDESDGYLRKLSSDWGRLMNDAREQIDAPDFMTASCSTS
ncbi:peptidase [Novosphingobium lentum]|uniref:peptidase n=1 Tax=Novosphingobium lentum TaxID=145287 RepID=UPI00082F2B17|nr:peptidase [Novosphingobium lentum]